jgi:hypothetical protein
MQPWIGPLDRRDRRPLMTRSSLPQADDVTAQLAQQRAQALGHVLGLEVLRLEAAVHAQGLALGRDGEGGPRREPRRLVVRADEGRLSLGRPCAAARGNESVMRLETSSAAHNGPYSLP